MDAREIHESHLIQRRQFIKCHIMCGVKTNIVTAVEMTEEFSNDSPQFKPLVEATAKNFVMQEVSADKAYMSNANLQTVVDNHAQPHIPFKSNADALKRSPIRTALWKQMFHLYSYNTERFMEHYHKQINEALC
jgi:hypothetical protein